MGDENIYKIINWGSALMHHWILRTCISRNVCQPVKRINILIRPTFSHLIIHTSLFYISKLVGASTKNMLAGEGGYKKMYWGGGDLQSTAHWFLYKMSSSHTPCASWKGIRKKRLKKSTYHIKIMYLSFNALNGINNNSNSSLRECLKTLCTKRYKQTLVKITELQITSYTLLSFQYIRKSPKR